MPDVAQCEKIEKLERRAAGRARKASGEPVSINRWNEARTEACKAVGLACIELHVGHLGSRTRTHEIVPSYNFDCGIPNGQSYQDREDRRFYAFKQNYEREYNRDDVEAN